MNVRVLLFAGLRERAGAGELRIDGLPDGATAALLLERLRARIAGFDDVPFRIARNRALVATVELPTVRLAEGDEVALLPPVSGG